MTDRFDGYIFFLIFLLPSLFWLYVWSIYNNWNINLNQFISHKTLVLIVKKNPRMLICFHASHDVDLSILPKKGWWRFFLLLFFLMYTLFHKGISYSQSSFYCLLSSYQRDTGRYFFSFCKQSLYIVPCIFFFIDVGYPRKKNRQFSQDCFYSQILW